MTLCDAQNALWMKRHRCWSQKPLAALCDKLVISSILFSNLSSFRKLNWEIMRQLVEKNGLGRMNSSVARRLLQDNFRGRFPGLWKTWHIGWPDFSLAHRPHENLVVSIMVGTKVREAHVETDSTFRVLLRAPVTAKGSITTLESCRMITAFRWHHESYKKYVLR